MTALLKNAALVLPILVSLVGSTWYLAGRFATIETRLARIEDALQAHIGNP
jgi:hypothetical protein